MEDAVVEWAMERGRFGMGGFDTRRVAPGVFEASIELHHDTDDRNPKRRFTARGGSREMAQRACLATALRAVADELSPEVPRGA